MAGGEVATRETDIAGQLYEEVVLTRFARGERILRGLWNDFKPI